MLKLPLFISICPDDTKYLWQLRVQLYNFRKFGYSSNYHVLIFVPNSRLSLGPNPEINNLKKDFPETNFFIYEDHRNVERIGNIFNYQPVLRPWCLSEHFKKYKELEEEQIFYLDSDVIFTKYLDFSQFKADKCYLSPTPYIKASHFISKDMNVDSSKYEEFSKRDVLQEVANLCGIGKEKVLENDNNTGGAQSLLIGINHTFWTDVFNNSIEIRLHLQEFNRKFYVGNTPQEKEDNGLQSWAADMWALLYNLWKRDIKTDNPKELEFCWNTSPIELWESMYLYHDAGATSRFIGDGKQTFFKGDYNYNHIWNHPDIVTPFQQDLSYVSDSLCAKNYVHEINNCKLFFGL